MKKGFKHSEETIKKIKEARKKQVGENSSNWKGGITFREIPYPKTEHCEVCGRKERICWDHNHDTGRFRGWLCQSCNGALGLLRDDIEILKKLTEYLKIKTY